MTIKIDVRRNPEINEFRVQVGAATYYTSDKQDAINTCDCMQKEAGIQFPVCFTIRTATEAQRDNW